MKMTKQMKILVVDDSLDARNFVVHVLKKQGFTNILCANDGVEALKALREAVDDYDPIQLVLADWQMPQLDGYDLFLHTKRDRNLKDTVFIMVTADNEQEHVLKALGHGVDNYVLKPLAPEVLLTKITDSVKKHP